MRLALVSTLPPKTFYLVLKLFVTSAIVYIIKNILVLTISSILLICVYQLVPVALYFNCTIIYVKVQFVIYSLPLMKLTFLCIKRN